MPRPLRIDIEDGWHHVMNRGIDHGIVFFEDTDRIEFGQRLADMFDLFGIRIHAYCLMGTHFHLLCHCPDAGLSASMQRLGSLYTRHVNDRLGRDGALFRGRFHSRLIADDAHLLAAVRYIHRNPLDLPGVVRVIGLPMVEPSGVSRAPERGPWMVSSNVLDAVRRVTTMRLDRFVR